MDSMTDGHSFRTRVGLDQNETFLDNANPWPILVLEIVFASTEDKNTKAAREGQGGLFPPTRFFSTTTTGGILLASEIVRFIQKPVYVASVREAGSKRENVPQLLHRGKRL